MNDVGSCTGQVLMITFVFLEEICVLVLLVVLNQVGFFSSLCSLLNLKSTDVLENWLISSYIYCIITAPYCKSTVHLLYRESIPHCIPLYPNILSYCIPLYSTWQHCTYQLTVLYPTVRHCTEYWQTLYATVFHFTYFLISNNA